MRMHMRGVSLSKDSLVLQHLVLLFCSLDSRFLSGIHVAFRKNDASTAPPLRIEAHGA